MKLRMLPGFALLLSMAFLAPSAPAQTVSGRVVGSVQDPSGGVLPGATVLLEQPTTGFQQTQVTNDTGEFVFTFVPPGEYAVTVSMMGFKGIKRPVTVQAQSTVRADFTMAVEGLAEDVIVQAPAPVVRTENAELGEVINEKLIASVPLNGRRFADLVLLNAGAGVSTSGTSDTPLLQTGPNLNINGTRSTHNSYSIRWRHRDRLLLQQPERVHLGRRDPGVPDCVRPVRRRVRRQGWRPHPRRHQVGQQRHPRHGVRVLPR